MKTLALPFIILSKFLGITFCDQASRCFAIRIGILCPHSASYISLLVLSSAGDPEIQMTKISAENVRSSVGPKINQEKLLFTFNGNFLCIHRFLDRDKIKFHNKTAELWFIMRQIKINSKNYEMSNIRECENENPVWNITICESGAFNWGNK